MGIVKSAIIALSSLLFVAPAKIMADTKKAKEKKRDRDDPLRREGSNEMFLGADVGVPIDANSKSIRSAKATFDQTSSSIAGSYMGALRFGWKSKPESLLIGYGFGALFGTFKARGGSYGAGDVSLGLSAFYALGFARVGYYFTHEISAALQVENYLPLKENIVLTSPSGTVSETPDSAFEVSTHSALLMVQYDIQPKLSLGLNVYIPALIYSSIQGRGFTGLSVGVEYAI